MELACVTMANANAWRVSRDLLVRHSLAQRTALVLELVLMALVFVLPLLDLMIAAFQSALMTAITTAFVLTACALAWLDGLMSLAVLQFAISIALDAASVSPLARVTVPVAMVVTNALSVFAIAVPMELAVLMELAFAQVAGLMLPARPQFALEIVMITADALDLRNASATTVGVANNAQSLIVSAPSMVHV
jgi:hypothetical protein